MSNRKLSFLFAAIFLVCFAGCIDTQLSPTPSSPLEGTKWVLTSLNGQSPIKDTTITLEFSNGFVSGRAGCNFYEPIIIDNDPDKYKYTSTADGGLTIAGFTKTLLLCPTPEGIIEQEDAYFEALQSATAYRLTETGLEISAASGEVSLVFIPLSAPPNAQPTEPPASSTPQPAPTAQSPTATPAPAVVQINPETTFQTLDGIGANCWTFPYANDLEWNWEAVKYVFDELDIAYLRLAPWLGWWETANDNDDPFTINWEGFGTVYDIINNHDVPFGQFLTARGIELSVGVWDFGGVMEYCDTCTDWLAAGQPRQIPPSLYPEMGESIASYILHMQQNSVPITFAEVQNEPDIQAGIQYPSPEALRDAGKVLLQMLDHYDLQSIQLHAPNLHSPTNNVRWIETWLEDETLRQRTAAVSYHTWWSEHRPDYEAIWQAAQKYNMPVWATEAGYSGSATSIDPKKWLTAFGFAESYYRAIAWSHASRVYHWSLLGFDGAVGKQGERYPMLYALKHFTNYIPAGSVLIESQSDDPQVLTLAFQRPDGAYSIILLNRQRAPRTVAITGLTGEISQLVTSSETAYETAMEPAAGGSLTLPSLSITSLVWQP